LEKKTQLNAFHNLYTSPDVLSVIKSRSTTWAKHVACIDEMKNAYRSFGRKLQIKKPRWRHSHYWWIILKNVLKQ